MSTAYREPVFGNLAVAREVLKQVYVAEKLAPPSLAQVSSTCSSLPVCSPSGPLTDISSDSQFFHSAQSMSYWRSILQSGEWKRWAIYGIEAWGIFKIGEMIGRRHIVGYKLEESRYSKLT